MAVYGQPKGKDASVTNEGREQKKGLSKTEVQNMMKKMMGGEEPGTAPAANPLLPGAKGGKRGRPY